MYGIINMLWRLRAARRIAAKRKAHWLSKTHEHNTPNKPNQLTHVTRRSRIPSRTLHFVTWQFCVNCVYVYVCSVRVCVFVCVLSLLML